MREGFRAREYIICAAAVVGVFLLCVCAGSVNVPLRDVFASIGSAVRNAFTGQSSGTGSNFSIIVHSRLPRVLCVGLVGAALSVCGGAMQGLLRNPLADGSTLGVSSGASLGAVIAIAIGFSIPGFTGGGTMIMSIVFAFLTLVLVLGLAYRLDYSLSTNTIILIGIVFQMLATSLVSLVVTFAGDRVKTIVFWTMGSLSGSTYVNVLTLLAALVICGGVLLRYSRELNAFAIGEDNARHLGIDVRRVKLVVMIMAAVLIGVCVSIGGTIAFVGLVTPHILRMITGPNHKKLLPASLFGGAAFLMLADLVARVLLRPRELPLGVVTSIVGSVVFILIFYRMRKKVK